MELKIRRESHNSKVKFSLAKRQVAEYRIEEMPTATPEQLEVRQGWLEGRTAGK
jgi:hypothetical protein